MPTARLGLSVAVMNGILYAIGGVNPVYYPNSYLNVVEAYDTATDTWTTKAPTPTPRYSLVAGTINSTIHAVGGWNEITGDLGTVEAYTP